MTRPAWGPDAPRDCNVVTEYHLGPIETDIGGRGGEYIVDVCRHCGYEYAVSWASPKRREAVRRAVAAHRAKGEA